jgi:hypothetical protein
MAHLLMDFFSLIIIGTIILHMNNGLSEWSS